MQKKPFKYVTPQIETLDTNGADLICKSPEHLGNNPDDSLYGEDNWK